MIAALFNSADRAIAYWRENDLDIYDYILLLPGTDAVLNELIRAAFEAKLGVYIGHVIESDSARLISSLYSLYEFTDKLIIGSFDLPHGRKLRNLLISGSSTEEELINDVILGNIAKVPKR